MFKGTVDRISKESVRKNCNSEFVTPDELEKALSDALYSLVNSPEFIHLIDTKLGESLQSHQRGR